MQKNMEWLINELDDDDIRSLHHLCERIKQVAKNKEGWKSYTDIDGFRHPYIQPCILDDEVQALLTMLRILYEKGENDGE